MTCALVSFSGGTVVLRPISLRMSAGMGGQACRDSITLGGLTLVEEVTQPLNIVAVKNNRIVAFRLFNK